MESLLLLGQDFGRRDQVHQAELGPVRAAISAGASVESPGAASKIDANEDALLVLLEGERALLAVTDAHFGASAGHELLTRLQQRCRSIPTHISELSMLLVGLTEPPTPSPSGTTLTVCIVELDKAQGFGICFGDSDVFVVKGDFAEMVTTPNNIYLHLDRPMPLELANRFEFDYEGGRLLLCSDGITECHYRSPSTSIGPAHLAELHRTADSDAVFTEKLANLALTGVDGNPGGQDNLVVLTTS